MCAFQEFRIFATRFLALPLAAPNRQKAELALSRKYSLTKSGGFKYVLDAFVV